MKLEDMKEQKKKAEEYANSLLQQKEEVSNAIQQVIGRVQLLNELITEAEKVDEPIEVADEKGDKLP